MAQVNNWEAKRNYVNKLVAELQKKPENEKLAYSLSPAGILNAYREGDVLFEVAISQLREWAIKYAAQQGVQSDGGKSYRSDTAEIIDIFQNGGKQHRRR